MGRELFAVDWKELNTPLGLPGQRQGVCARTFFVPLSDDLPPKDPQVRYFATSLPPHQAASARLAELIRGHWGVENRLHHVKDRTFLEDRHWVNNRRTANVFTFLRSTVTGMLHKFKIPDRRRRAHCPEKIEYMQADVTRPLRLVRGGK